MFRRMRRMWREGRRGAVVALVAVSSTVMAGFAALTIDVGTIYIARTELQRVADASALAGASAYFSDTGLQQSTFGLITAVTQRSSAVAHASPVCGGWLVLASSDVTLGQHDYTHPTAPMAASTPWNAVQVMARRTSTSPNRAMPLIFGRIWNHTEANLAAVARAAADDRMAGYVLENNTSGTGLMPFAIPRDAYYQMLQSGTDAYSYDGHVSPGADGIREVKMYPWDAGAPGNFGILDMNRPNDGASALSDQIEDGGASAADVMAELHTTTLTFYDAAHTSSPITYSCSGTPGMKTSIQLALLTQVGKVCAFFLHDGVQSNGQHATYAISGMFWGRIMAADVSGSKKASGLVVQPVAHTDTWVVTSQYAPSSHGTAGRLTLVQ